jgi:hypothetical protein
MAVSAPTLEITANLGAVSGTFTSVTMSGGVGAPDHSFTASSPFLGIELRCYVWEDVAAGSYTIAQTYSITSPSDTASFTITGGSGSRVVMWSAFNANIMHSVVVEVTGAGTVGTATEVGGDGTGASQTITSTSGGRVFAALAGNWNPAPNQTEIAEAVVTGVVYINTQHADGTGSGVAMNFTGAVDQVAYIGFNIQESAGGGGSINFDEDYQLILPVAAAW